MTGLRTKQKFDRNSRILQAAAELFRASGYEAATMEAIATASEVSIGTIYNYYKNKGDLLLAIVSMEVHEILSAGASVVDNPPLNAGDAIDILLGIYIEHSLVYLSKEMWRVAMSISTQQPDSPFGLSYIALDEALAIQTCDLVKKLQALGLVYQKLDAVGMGDMFVGFVKSEAMTVKDLRHQLSRQNKIVVDAASTSN
jgi:AcrR family transcriptional regulator